MFLSEIFSILDARSFSSPWFWLVLISVWSLSGRGVLGVPNDVLYRAGRILRDSAVSDPAEDTLLLDWLSLQLSRWRIPDTGGIILVAAGTCLLTVLFMLGFGFGLEMAQAMSLIMLPMAILLVLRLRLARRLQLVIDDARQGASIRASTTEAMKYINRYRALHMIISVVAVLVTTLWASLWMLLHPNGL